MTKNHYNIVISLQLILKKNLKKDRSYLFYYCFFLTSSSLKRLPSISFFWIFLKLKTPLHPKLSWLYLHLYILLPGYMSYNIHSNQGKDKTNNNKIKHKIFLHLCNHLIIWYHFILIVLQWIFIYINHILLCILFINYFLPFISKNLLVIPLSEDLPICRIEKESFK